MSCSNEPRANESEVKVPVILGEGFSGDPTCSCSCYQAVESVIVIPYATKSASDNFKNDCDCWQEKGYREILSSDALSQT